MEGEERRKLNICSLIFLKLDILLKNGVSTNVMCSDLRVD
jgi:hypothetical protein